MASAPALSAPPRNRDVAAIGRKDDNDLYDDDLRRHVLMAVEDEDDEEEEQHLEEEEEEGGEEDEMESKDFHDNRTEALREFLAALYGHQNLHNHQPGAESTSGPPPELTPANLARVLADAHPGLLARTVNGAPQCGAEAGAASMFPASGSPRAQRYAVTRLARALTAVFDPRAAAAAADGAGTARAATPPNTHPTPSAASPSAQNDVADDIQPPHVARETLAFLRKVGADAAVGKKQLDEEETIVHLGIVVLCAALHSHLRNTYVDAVMSLPDHVQDILADAVYSAVNGGARYDGEVDTVDTRGSGSPPEDYDDINRSLNKQSNLHLGAQAEAFAAPQLDLNQHRLVNNVPVVVRQAHRSRAEPACQPLVLREKNAENIPHDDHVRRMSERKRGSPRQLKSGANGITVHAGVEAAELRERVLSLEHELRLKCAELESVSAQASAAKQDTAGPKPGKPGASPAVRPAALQATDLEILRAKAASADALEVSLKRATARMEQAGEMRRHATDLENQNAALRDGEQRLQKRVAYLENQLDANTARSETLVEMNEALSAELQSRESQLANSRVVIAELSGSLEDAKTQIESLLISGQSPTLSAAGKASPPPIPLDPSAVSAALERELGVIMSWDDVVECVRGVVEAMREIDEAEAAERQANEDALRVEQGRLRNKRPHESFSSAEGAVTSSGQVFESTFGSTEADPGRSRIPVLRDFIEVDEHMEACGRPGGDDFDFAADHANVKELVVQFETYSGNENSEGPARRDRESRGQREKSLASDDKKGVSSRFANATLAMPRRRSSTPSLPTVPEDSEGFVVRPADEQSRATTPSESDEHTDNIRSGEESRPSTKHRAPATAQASEASLTGPEGIVQRIVGSYEGTELADIRAANDDSVVVEARRGHRPSTPSQALDLIARQLAEQTAISNAKERECADLRHELSLLIKEVDGIIAQRDSDAMHERDLMAEKERWVAHLQSTLASCSDELASTKRELACSRAEIDKLRGENQKAAAEAIREDIRQASKQHSEKLAEIHRSALEAAADREYNVDMRLCKSRKSTRLGALWRRLANPDAVSEYDTMLTLRPITADAPLMVSGRPNVLYDRH